MSKIPRVDFSFQGVVRGARIRKATDQNGEQVNVVGWSDKRLAKALNAGKLFISLGDYLYGNRKNEIEMFDFTPTAEDG
jgi:hypothetical protein